MKLLSTAIMIAIALCLPVTALADAVIVNSAMFSNTMAAPQVIVNLRYSTILLAFIG